MAAVKTYENVDKRVRRRFVDANFIVPIALPFWIYERAWRVDFKSGSKKEPLARDILLTTPVCAARDASRLHLMAQPLTKRPRSLMPQAGAKRERTRAKN